MKSRLCGFVGIVGVLLVPGLVAAQLSFTDSTSALLSADNNSGCAMGVTDMNGDGKDDIVRFYNSHRNMRIEYQQASGAPFTTFDYGRLPGNISTWAVALADYDHNGYCDIVVGGASGGVALLTANNSGSNYSDEILDDPSIFLQGCNFADMNNDGWLDLLCCDDVDDNHKYRNTGNGSMVLDNGLLNTSINGGNAGNYATVWSDFDNDGDIDMYLSKCRLGNNNPSSPLRINRLFRNDGNGFTDVAGSAGVATGEQSWASDFGDIDNDGDMDLVIMNHTGISALMENDGNGEFTDITASAGLVSGLQGLYGLQVAFRDFDNDGFLDIIVASTFDTPERFFLNDGDSTFTLVDSLFHSSDDMHSFAIGDLNGDGFLDVYAGYGRGYNSSSNIDDRVFINSGNSNSYFGVRLVGSSSNINGVGARLELHGSWGKQIREVRAGESYGITCSLNKYFGLGAADSIDKLVVKWPSGTVDEVLNPTPNTMFTLTEGTFPLVSGDFNGDGDVDGDDVDFYIGNLDQPAMGSLSQLDLNGDGDVTIADHDLHVTTLVVTSNGVTGGLLGDVNLDGPVDVLLDGFALVGGLGQDATGRSQGDLNADGVVDVLGDAFILVSQLGQSNEP